MKKTIIALLIIAFGFAYTVAQETPKIPEQEQEQGTQKFEGTMTIEKMDEIVAKIDDKAQKPRDGAWQFALAGIPVMIVTDTTNDRMRIMAPVRQADDMTKDDLMRIAQANFDSALDARYAVANGLLWAVYIHPLRALHERQFVSGIAQTATSAATYGKSYSSGALFYRGGDSQGIIENQIRDLLKDKGLEV